MKTDLLLMPMGARIGEMRAAAIAAEEAGFDGLWTWDHLRDPDDPGAPVPEAWTALTVLAEATTRVNIGPLVLNVINRHPGLLANMAATLQEASGGRLLLGLGAGGGRALPYASEQLMIGQPVEPDRVRARRVTEAATVLRRLWSGGDDGFAGRYYRLDRPAGYLRPDPPPPIIIGGFGPRMARIAGLYGDGFNAPAGLPALERLLAVARAARAESGRDPQRFSLSVFAGLSERWLRPASPDRERLDRLDVARLILLMQPPFSPGQIREAGRLLRG